MTSRTACLIVLALAVSGPASSAERSPRPAKKTTPAAKRAKARPGKAQASAAPWEAHQESAVEQFKLGKYEEAAAAYDKGIEAAQAVFSAPEFSADTGKAMVALARMYARKGEACLKLKKNDEAVAAYEKAVEFSANKPAAYFDLCAAHYNLGRMERAKASCGKALSVDPSGPRAAEVKGMLNKTSEGK